jgi:creatinine amidohydrolase
MHHSASLDIEAPVLRSLWDSLFASLAAAGWDIIVVISGHCAPGHELLLMDAAEETINRHGVLVLALPPLALVDETMLDHAALWETSLLLALQPDLVNLPALGSAPLNAEESGVVGQDPRGAASPSLGSTAIHMAVEHLVKAVQQLRNKGNAAELAALYAQRRTRYRS